jgi:hypothetical protein
MWKLNDLILINLKYESECYQLLALLYMVFFSEVRFSQVYREDKQKTKIP